MGERGKWKSRNPHGGAGPVGNKTTEAEELDKQGGKMGAGRAHVRARSACTMGAGQQAWQRDGVKTRQPGCSFVRRAERARWEGVGEREGESEGQAGKPMPHVPAEEGKRKLVADGTDGTCEASARGAQCPMRRGRKEGKRKSKWWGGMGQPSGRGPQCPMCRGGKEGQGKVKVGAGQVLCLQCTVHAGHCVEVAAQLRCKAPGLSAGSRS